MKKLILVSSLALLLVFSFSCKKDDSVSTATGFSAKVQGTMWTASNSLASHSSLNNISTITGLNASGTEQIVLMFIGSGTGTYKMNDDNMGSILINNNLFSSFMSDIPDGEIIITKYDATNLKISGIFKFKGEDSNGTIYNLTEGKFDNVQLVIQ